jgi:hypothetical protein
VEGEDGDEARYRLQTEGRILELAVGIDIAKGLGAVDSSRAPWIGNQFPPGTRLHVAVAASRTASCAVGGPIRTPRTARGGSRQLALPTCSVSLVCSGPERCGNGSGATVSDARPVRAGQIGPEEVCRHVRAMLK